MSSKATTSYLHPMLAPLRTIVARHPVSSDHDTAHAYGALREYLDSVKRTEDPDAVLPLLRVHFRDLAESIEHDIMYATYPMDWLKMEGIWEAESEELYARGRIYGGALRCFEALRTFDVLCTFFDELLVQYSQDFLRIYQTIIAIVGASTLYFEVGNIRPKAAYTLRMRLSRLPEALLDELYEPYVEAMHAVLQNKEYAQKDDDVLHYSILSVANLINEYPSTALPHLTPLLPELYPILTSCYPTLRTRATQAVTGIAHAYLFYPTPETSSSDFEREIGYPLRDWSKAEGKLRSANVDDTFWNRLRESKRGGGTWAWRISATLLALLGRRIWWLPGSLKMLTFCVQPDKPKDDTPLSSSPGSSDGGSVAGSPAAAPAFDEDDSGTSREELTADIYRILAHSFACMRLWQQKHSESVSRVEKKSQSQQPVTDHSLSLLLDAWPSLPTPAAPEPHQPSNPTQSYAGSTYSAAASFVPAMLCALGPKADDQDKAWNINAALSIVRRMVQDGAKDGEDMLARLVGTSLGRGEDVEMESDEDGDTEIVRREAVLARLLSCRALGKSSAPAETPVGASDVMSLNDHDIVTHWTALADCWAMLVQHSSYSDKAILVFEALLRSSAPLQDKIRLVEAFTTIIVLPPDGDSSAYDLQCQFWDVAIKRLSGEILQPVAQPLLQALLTSPPSEAGDLSSRTTWARLACMLGAGDMRDGWSAVEEVVRGMSTSAVDNTDALTLAVALARSAPLRLEATQSLGFISQYLKGAYDTLHQTATRTDVPTFTIFSILQANVASRGISIRSVVTLLPGLDAWVGDGRHAIPDDLYNDVIVKMFEVLLDALEPPIIANAPDAPPTSSCPSDIISLSDLTALAPLFTSAMDRLTQPGHAADALWAFWTRVHGRLGLKGDDYPYQIQAIVSALCVFLGHEVPEGMETQEDTGASQMGGQGTPSIQMSQPPAQEQNPKGSSQLDGQTSSAMYWAAQSSLSSRLLKTQQPRLASMPLQARVLPSPSQLAGLAGRVQASLARREEAEAPPAKRRRLTPEAEERDEAQGRSGSARIHFQLRGPTAARRPPSRQEEELPAHSHSDTNHPQTASSSRSRKSHLPTPAPSEAPLSSPIGEPDELAGDDEEVVPASEPDDDWDGDEGMIVDEDDGDGDEEDCRKDATRSIQCARGHAEDVPGVGYGDGGNVTRSSLFGRYSYSRREKDDDEIVPATPGADDDQDYSSPAAKFFSSTRKRITSGTSPILTFNLSYSHAGSPSPKVPPTHRAYFAESPVGADSPPAQYSYSEQGSIEFLRRLPRGQKPTGAAASASNAYAWQDESGEIPGLGGGDIPGFGPVGAGAGDGGPSTQPGQPDPDVSGRFSYSERGSLEMLRNLPRGPGALGLRTDSGSHAKGAGAYESDDGAIPGLGGDALPGLGGDIPGLALGGGPISQTIPGFDNLVDAINTVETYVARGVKDERALAELARLRGALARLE
ncbi:unnamed protein product [Peniophora sp. CBMAI 1063]|nr:unnamed protein product [Peniophora sp. CBMAI 1063]